MKSADIKRTFIVSGTGLAILSMLLMTAMSARAEEFGRGARRALLNVITSDLPQGKAHLSGGERSMGPGHRSPWHTAGGPKLLYVLSGSLTVEGLNGRTLLTCEPGPKLCVSSYKELFFFANRGPAPVKFVVVGIDPVGRMTSHEQIGQVAGISGNAVTIALGDVRTSGLVSPRKELVIRVADLNAVSVGDDVVTFRYSAIDHTAGRLSKLSRRWR